MGTGWVLTDFGVVVTCLDGWFLWLRLMIARGFRPELISDYDPGLGTALMASMTVWASLAGMTRGMGRGLGPASPPFSCEQGRRVRARRILYAEE